MYFMDYDDEWTRNFDVLNDTFRYAFTYLPHPSRIILLAGTLRRGNAASAKSVSSNPPLAFVPDDRSP